MSKSKSFGNDFVICVREPDPRVKTHILIHPVLLILNDNPSEIVAPQTVIDSFKFLNCPENGKLISIFRSQVSEKNWKLLLEGLKDSKAYKAGVHIEEATLRV